MTEETQPRLAWSGLIGKVSGLRARMLIAFALKGVAAVASFAFNWLIARHFGAHGVGQFALALTTMVLTSTIAIAGLDTILVRTVAIERARNQSGAARTAVRKIVTHVLPVALVLGAALFFGRDLVATYVAKEPLIAPMIGAMAFCIPILAMSKLASSGLRGVDRIGISQAVDGPIGTMTAAILFGVAILLGVAHSPLLPAVLYCLCWGMATALGWFVFLKDVRRWGAPTPFDEPLWRAGLPVVCSTLSLLFVDWFVMLQLSSVRTVAEAGLFRVAFQIVATLNLIVAASESILSPVIAESFARGDKYRISRISQLTVVGMMAAASPILLAVLFAPHFLMGLFGPDFTAGATALQILAVGQAFNLLTGPGGSILIMTKHERWLLAYAVMSAGMAAALSFLLIPKYGVNGAAIAVSASIVFRKTFALVLVRWVVGIKIFERKPQ